MEKKEFERFRSLIHQQSGIWLRDGKEVMLSSRLSRRLRHHNFSNFSEYYAYVNNCKDDGEELKELINCVTTNKTFFFRESHHFEFLAEKAVPEALESFQHAGRSYSRAKRTFRVWSAACATGEEAFTTAITLLEARQQWRLMAPREWEFRIVASDIDTDVLAKASEGIYSDLELENIPVPLHKKYFLRGTGSATGQIKVKSEVHSLVEFSRINLVEPRWPLQDTFDAIFFRNALIYFQKETQDMILRRMAKHLKPGGYLFLGHSEHIPWLHGIYKPLHNTVFQLRETLS
ncbi:CheR family methyltransferase [Telmatobacter bradus]|uniref:CheR family methyltransferase n=1 Tax=Telmatobacter bradus TaxID=474953 RepID=UPI003B42EE1E